MTARLSPIEHGVLERAIRDAGPVYDSTPIVAVVEAILLSRQLRARPAGYLSPEPRLRAVPPRVGKVSPSLRLLRDTLGNMADSTSPRPP